MEPQATIDALQAEVNQLRAEQDARNIDDAFKRDLDAAAKEVGVTLKEGVFDLIRPYVEPKMIDGEVRSSRDEFTPLRQSLVNSLRGEFRPYVDRIGGGSEKASSYDPDTFVPGRASEEDRQKLRDWLQEKSQGA